MLSPDGAFVAYPYEGDYIAFDAAQRTRRNLTAGLATRFMEPVDLQSRVRQHLYPFPVFRGWGDGRSSIQLSDHYDIWSLPLRAGEAVNLTVTGSSDGVIFIPTRLASAGEHPSGEYDDMRSQSLSLADDLCFRVVDSRTLRTGPARRGGSIGTHLLKTRRCSTFETSRYRFSSCTVTRTRPHRSRSRSSSSTTCAAQGIRKLLCFSIATASTRSARRGSCGTSRGGRRDSSNTC